eukprot:360527-Chlamydomonas_euryale.AAC.7
MVKQPLFDEGLVRLGAKVGSPRSTWQDMAVAALSPVLTSRLVGWGGVGWGMGWLRTTRSCIAFVTAPSPLFDLRRLAALNIGIPFMGPLPSTLTPTLRQWHKRTEQLVGESIPQKTLPLKE